jgi:hypothetical protein
LWFCPGLTPDFDTPTYSSHVAHPQACTTTPYLFVEMRVSWTFLPRLASNYDPPNHFHPSSWYYRHKPLCQACYFIFIGWNYFIFPFNTYFKCGLLKLYYFNSWLLGNFPGVLLHYFQSDSFLDKCTFKYFDMSNLLSFFSWFNVLLLSCVFFCILKEFSFGLECLIKAKYSNYLDLCCSNILYI